MNSIKTLLYMGGMHGFFTFYMPYQLALLDSVEFDFGVFRYLSFLLWVFGTAILIWCSVDMVRRGRGTPAHADPPKKLIVQGLYRYTRNPIYLGALMILLAYILWFGSELIFLYFLLFALAYQILITLVEEPLLRNMFGQEYEAYCQQVGRWLPRIKSK